MNNIRRLIILFTVLLTPMANANDNSGNSDSCEWLYSRQMEMYFFLLRSPDLSPSIRDKLKEGFHRFAFEYWLLTKSNGIVSRAVWRGYIRGILHREAADERYWNDPGSLTPFFVDNRLRLSIAVAPVNGLQLAGLSEDRYRKLVDGFHLAYADFQQVFPPDSIRHKPFVVQDDPGHVEEVGSLRTLLADKKWTFLRADRLPWSLQNDPSLAFKLLTPDGQAYFMPAFLRMCEAKPEQGDDLPHTLLSMLVGSSKSSAELCNSFNDYQKRCVFTYFRDWYKGTPIDELRSKLGLGSFE